MLRGLSTGSKVRLGIVGAGLIGCFGYAFSQGKPPGTIDQDALDEFTYGGSTADERAARMAVEEADESRHEVELATTRRLALATLLGPHAQPGSAFDGMQWHGLTEKSEPDAAEHVLDALRSYDGGVASPSDLVEAPDGVSVRAHGLVRSELIEAWGTPDLGDATWLDPEHHWCTTLRDDTLQWRQCQPLEEMVRDPKTGAFGFEPIPLLGARARDIIAAFGADQISEHDGLLSGHLEGVRSTDPKPIDIEVTLDRQRVAVAVRVTLYTDQGETITRAIDETPFGGRQIRVTAGDDQIVVDITPAPRHR
jgi:hypothetical protein